MLILSSLYLPPIQYFAHLYADPVAIEDQGEHFIKQTYRNRCLIATPNGPQALTIPVVRDGSGGHTPMHDVRISSHGNWRHLHWQALLSAYGETPFFEFYADDLRPFFEERRWTFLLDFNLDITRTVCSLLDIRPEMSLSRHYIEDPQAVDLRDAIRPKHPLPDPEFEPQPYYQVRSARHGFLPNLSVLDLLFNEGPEGIFWL